MAGQIGNIPYYAVSFDAKGNVLDDGGLEAAVAAGGIQQLFVFSHGWNNSAPDAQHLYDAMFGLLSPMLGDEAAASAAVGVFWPSLLLPDDGPSPAGGGATPASGAQIAAALAPAFPEQPDNVAQLGALLDDQPQDALELRRFHALAAGLATTPDPGGPEDSGLAGARTGDTAAVFGHASAMSKAPANNAQGLGNPFTALWHGAREVLRTLSYYEMKNRAGVVGRSGLGPLIGRLSTAHPGIRVNLMGHSFGARLVASALAGLPDAGTGTASPVTSLLLVQGAFSHFAFSPSLPMHPGTAGALSGFVDRVNGPLLATHTLADRAVGWWYPTASMLSHSNAEAASDLTYEWGAMGHDGYQQDGVQDLLLGAQGSAYELKPGTVYRLDANAVIKTLQSAFSGAHSDIEHPEVAWAFLAASRPR